MEVNLKSLRIVELTFQNKEKNRYLLEEFTHETRYNSLRLKIEISKAISPSRASVINIGKPLYFLYRANSFGKEASVLTRPVYANMLIYRTFALLFHRQLSPISFLSRYTMRSYTPECSKIETKYVVVARSRKEGSQTEDVQVMTPAA